MLEGPHGGALHGLDFVVKDVFDVAGYRTGAGNPEYRAQHGAATVTAPAVTRVVDAGARLVGKAVTDEFTWSLAGTNPHYGTPRNPRDPDRFPGGSSSGSAVAVAAGFVPFALGTDTAGSVRVPASYCGVFGMRPTHGRIDNTGVVPLAARRLLHRGVLPGYPASHGCIRLPNNMAEWFFANVQLGTPVAVRGVKYGIPIGHSQGRPRRAPKVHPSLKQKVEPAVPPAPRRRPG
jgi:hypothetical protein